MKAFFLSTLLFVSGVLGQDFNYKNVPSSYITNVALGSDYNNLLLQAFDVTNSLPTNYVKDGTVDYTTYLQQALNSHRVVKLPNFLVSINFKGLNLISNSTIIFDNNSKIKMIPNDKSGYNMLSINGKSNIKLLNPKLVGDRNGHLGNKGEWGMGIGITNSSNIQIINPNIRDLWGDGIYIGGNKYSKDITVKGGIIDNNRRNGITIVSGDNVKISNLVVSNSNGANPMTGIDIEPNSENNLKINVDFNSVTTFNNRVSGITFNLNHLKSTTLENSVNINLQDFKDQYSSYGISYSNMKSVTKKNLEGSVRFTNINLSNNQIPIRFMNNNSSLDNMKLSTSGIQILHQNSSKYISDLNSFRKQGLIQNKK